VLIAIDYDGTYTADPELWEIIIKMMQLRGHEVVCVTGRVEGETVHCSCMPYYTGYKAKREWCAKNGLHVDIWIDDKPEYIVRNYSESELVEIETKLGVRVR
jgi:hypothetical protein